MRAFTFLTGLAATTLPLVLAGDAPKTTDQPDGVQYIATLPDTSPVTGSVMIGSGTAGNGVQVQVAFAGFSSLPEQGGPYREFSLVHANAHDMS